jgi:cellulose biosynthesis protein BcsQ
MRKKAKTIGLYSKKGGVGKTTVAALLSLQFSKKGYRVGVLDTDELQIAAAWVSNCCEDENIQLYHPSQKNDIIIKDSGGGLTAAGLKELNAECDLIIVPMALTAAEIAGTNLSLQHLTKSAKKFKILLNRVGERTQAFAARQNTLAALQPATALKSYLTNTVQYQNIIQEGCSALDKKRKDEAKKLINEISKLINL